MQRARHIVVHFAQGLVDVGVHVGYVGVHGGYVGVHFAQGLVDGLESIYDSIIRGHVVYS